MSSKKSETGDDLLRAEALAPILEAVLFSAPEPLTVAHLLKVFGDENVSAEEVRFALQFLSEKTSVEGRGVHLTEVAGGWQFLTRPAYFPYVQRIAKTREAEKLTPAAIETLAVVAYKQPITRAEVDSIRGAASGPILRSLMDRGLVRVGGRADLPGAPFTYVTTKEFLKHFGLRSPKDLPDAKEWGRILQDQGRSAMNVPRFEPEGDDSQEVSDPPSE